MRRLAGTLLTLVLLTGCSANKPWLRSAGSFATLATPGLAQVSAAYTTANNVHTLQEQAVLVAQFSSQGYRPGTLKDFLSGQDLQARLAAISVLKDYVSLVGALTTANEAEIDTKTKALTNSIKAAAAATGGLTATSTDSTAEATSGGKTTVTTTKTTTTTKTKTAINQQEMGVVLSGLDAAIKPLIRHKVSKHLPLLVRAADPTIQQLCTLLAADMNDLRSQAKVDYDELLMEQYSFVVTNGASLSALDKRSEILKLLQIEADAAKTDSDLANAQKAVQQLAAAHKQLAGAK